jgi:hypothetical protein
VEILGTLVHGSLQCNGAILLRNVYSSKPNALKCFSSIFVIMSVLCTQNLNLTIMALDLTDEVRKPITPLLLHPLSARLAHRSLCANRPY